MTRILLTLSIVCTLSAIALGVFTENDTRYTDTTFRHGSYVRAVKGSHTVLYTIASF